MHFEEFEDHCWRDIVSEETLAIYEPYMRNLYIGQRPALLSIDLYNSVFPSESLPMKEAMSENPKTCGPLALQAIEPLKRLFAIVRTKGIPVFHVTHETRGVTQETTIHATNRSSSVVNERDFAFYPDFSPLDKEIVIYKLRASAFFGTPLIAYLVREGVDTLIICGESTSGCVRASVVDGYSFGFHMVVVEEAVFDRSLHIHKINLFDLHHKYADVMHLSEVERHLREFDPRDP